ncbi:hypothetical protein CDAR_378971 [Caerostris darwini]|uniref:Uncharacterized protein n=1 Tax=Caerostris darwini TaxID=1538125 RepID=A0AAV4TW33_9ARAC|nr:hypothetical protein CDAR_378971 [Caerostris darwini]
MDGRDYPESPPPPLMSPGFDNANGSTPLSTRSTLASTVLRPGGVSLEAIAHPPPPPIDIPAQGGRKDFWGEGGTSAEQDSQIGNPSVTPKGDFIFANQKVTTEVLCFLE